MNTDTIHRLFHFLKKSPSAFHAVRTISELLLADGYHELLESESWNITPGGKYFVSRNGSSIIAFHTGKVSGDYGFQICASHSDSPTFKLKEHAELEVRGKYTQLNTEGYGGMLCSTWFDRPLSIAGRVVIKKEHSYQVQLLDIDRDLLLIPSLAIHMNRQANDGFSYNKQIDLLPLFTDSACTQNSFRRFLASELKVSEDSIYGTDLYLYNRSEPSLWGKNMEFLSAPRLDNLECAYASLMGFLHGAPQNTINVYACFDNEEVGSGTRQGAGSSFLYDVLHRINDALGKNGEDYQKAVARSFLISADNAHAVHPNHPEKTDTANCVYMNQGVVIKSHAGQKYTSDAVSIAIFRALCEQAHVPVQFFSNRSDQTGGSTLGNISSQKVPVRAVDVGLAQLSMHSAYETAGAKDVEDMIRVMETFYQSCIQINKEGEFSLS